MERKYVDQLISCPLPPLLCFVLSRQLGEHGYLIEGCVALAKESLNKCIPYKYWVSYGQYEFIYKNPVSNHYVNRCLCIKSALISNGGELF